MGRSCWGCTDRRVTEDYNCHSTCKDYLKRQAEDEARRAKHLAEMQLDSYRSEQIVKAKSKIRKFRGDYKDE